MVVTLLAKGLSVFNSLRAGLRYIRTSISL